jgi:hypothetical protein
VNYTDIRSQEEMAEAKTIILPAQGRKKYCIVTGQRGLGKSVLVRHLAYHTPGIFSLCNCGDLQVLKVFLWWMFLQQVMSIHLGVI